VSRTSHRPRRELSGNHLTTLPAGILDSLDELIAMWVTPAIMQFGMMLCWHTDTCKAHYKNHVRTPSSGGRLVSSQNLNHQLVERIKWRRAKTLTRRSFHRNRSHINKLLRSEAGKVPSTLNKFVKFYRANILFHGGTVPRDVSHTCCTTFVGLKRLMTPKMAPGQSTDSPACRDIRLFHKADKPVSDLRDDALTRATGMCVIFVG